MAFLFNACQEGKATARPVEILCPYCGEEMEVFEHLGSERAGRTEADETCPACKRVIPMDTFISSLSRI